MGMCYGLLWTEHQKLVSCYDPIFSDWRHFPLMVSEVRAIIDWKFYASFYCSFGELEVLMPEMTLRYGSTGTGVLRLQQLLNTSLQKRPPLRTDSFYGPQTESVVRLYQSSVGLKVDGVAGPETWRALEKRLVIPKRFASPATKSFPPVPWMRVAMRAVEGVMGESAWLVGSGVPVLPHPSQAPPTPHPLPECEEEHWLAIAMREVGQKEVEGPDSNPRILEYQSATTLRARSDESPWCSSFVNWCMEQAGIPGTKSAAALSWVHWGKPSGPRPGAITIIYNPKAAGTRFSTSGYHVGFLLEEGASYYRLLGGNQHDQVNVWKFSKASNQQVGYRWPKP